MDLHTIQLIFYTLGSILFIALLSFIVFVVVTIFIIKRKLTKMSNLVDKKITKAMNVYDHKEKYILQLIGKGSSSLVENISNIFLKKK